MENTQYKHVGWIREWTFNGESKGAQLYDIGEEVDCSRDVKDDGGVCKKLYTMQQVGVGDFEVKVDSLTLRDYFAAKALTSMMEMSWPDLQLQPENGLTPMENCAKFAYQAADAMLKARAL